MAQQQKVFLIHKDLAIDLEIKYVFWWLNNHEKGP